MYESCVVVGSVASLGELCLQLDDCKDAADCILRNRADHNSYQDGRSLQTCCLHLDGADRPQSPSNLFIKEFMPQGMASTRNDVRSFPRLLAFASSRVLSPSMRLLQLPTMRKASSGLGGCHSQGALGSARTGTLERTLILEAAAICV